MNHGIRNKKREIRKIREQLTDEEVFLSKAYHDSLWKFARVLGGNQAVRLVLSYDKGDDSPIAVTTGSVILMNTANKVTAQFKQRSEKMASHEGLVAHECGHIRFSDFDRREVYAGGFSRGCIFPHPPEGNSQAERQAAGELKQLVKQRDGTAVSVISKVASYLNNVLEDVYIESRMCQRYPGSVRTSIQKNAAAVITCVPGVSERKKRKEGGLTIMLDLIFRYARSGHTEAEKLYDRQYRVCLDACQERIDEAVESDDPDVRFYVTNELLLKLWKYIKQDIQSTKADLGSDFPKLSSEEQKKKLDDYLDQKFHPVSLSGGYGGGRRRPKTIEGWDGELDSEESESGQSAKDEQEEGSQEKGKESSPEPDNGDFQEKEQEDENNSKEKTPGCILLFRREQADIQEGSERGNEGDGEPKGLCVSQGAMAQDENGEKILVILNQAAEEEYGKQAEITLNRMLREEAENLSAGGIHRGVPVKVSRQPEPSEMAKMEYQKIKPETEKGASRLRQAVEEILIRKEGGVLSGLSMGKRISRGNLYRQDGKIFEKRILPEEGFSLALAVLVDNSGSMECEERIDYAKKAAQVLYRFCQLLAIPVTVYGHSTYVESGSGQGVILYSCAEFDSVDGKDYLRIQEMKASECNRDGLALRFVGNHLAQREEEVKILILISDGSPYAVNYGGDGAKADLQRAKQELHKKGITLFSAAIGDDREVIEDIYGDSFLNISNLNTMPQKLAALLMKYIR